jgi:hypothetical protein
MPPKRANIIPPIPPVDQDEARTAWARTYRESFTTRWGPQGGFVNKTVAVRWAVSNQDLYRLEPLTTWGAALREYINLELRIDNGRSSNLLGPNGSWVKEYRRQMEEEGPKASASGLAKQNIKRL